MRAFAGSTHPAPWARSACRYAAKLPLVAGRELIRWRLARPGPPRPRLRALLADPDRPRAALRSAGRPPRSAELRPARRGRRALGRRTATSALALLGRRHGLFLGIWDDDDVDAVY